MRTDRTVAELIEVIPDAALIINRHSRLVLVNKMLVDMFGYTKPEELLGQPLDILLPESARGDHAKHVAAFFQCGENRPMGNGLRFSGQRQDGSILYVEIMLSHVEFENEHYAIAFVRDATEYRIMEDRIRRELEQERILAQTDHLTGLKNRRAFVRALERNIKDLQIHDRQFSVCFIDLDDFKLVNDNLGHDTGDRVLQQVAHIIEASCRSHDIVARIGGDEFATLHNGAELKDAMHVLERIRENLVQAFAEHEWPVTLSMGICHCYDPMLHRDASLILRAADKAMYEAKAQGKNQIRIATVAVYSE